MSQADLVCLRCPLSSCRESDPGCLLPRAIVRVKTASELGEARMRVADRIGELMEMRERLAVLIDQLGEQYEWLGVLMAADEMVEKARPRRMAA